jgi:GntR family transcriptional repressor for pyruvate dehydrogenase complex
MTTNFQPVRSRRVFEEILAQLRESLVAGEFVQGDRLPAERELAEQFGASRTSVREALRVLETLGVVQTKPGSDNGAVIITDPARAFRDILHYQLAFRHIDMRALVVFRIVIESWTANAAAFTCGPEALSSLQALVDAMDEDPSYHQFQAHDAAFHLEIARASGNDLFALTLEGARTTIERVMLEGITAARNWPSTKQRLVQEHQAILDAIAAGEADPAKELMAEHIRVFYNEHVLKANPIEPPTVVGRASPDETI